MKKSIQCPGCMNQDCLMKYCSQEWQQKIGGKKNFTNYPKGQNVIIEDNLVFGAYFIYEGKVKIIATNRCGKGQTVRLASKGHMIGHIAVERETYPIGAIALENSGICFVDNQSLFEAFMENPMFTFNAMLFYSRELRKSELRTKCLAQMNNEEKVIFGLVYLIESFGLNEVDQTITINLSRKEIADLIGTNTEQVSRVLPYLKEKKIIAMSKKQIQILDKAQLYARISAYW
jgi:CRP-like cAMP-binding protein